MSRVAIVILNWNGEDFLKKFLPSLIENTPETYAEIIVADNASTDNSLRFLKDNFPDIRCIALDKNYGFAGGYNKALSQVESEYYLLLNSDIEVTPNWLPPLVKSMDNDRNLASCSPVLLDYNRREKYEYAGAAGGYIDKLGYTFCRGRIFNTMENADLKLKESMEVFWTTGACMLVRAEYFIKEGGFDPYFFAHMEEVDLCWRFKNAGYKLVIIPNSKVFHVGGGTLPKSNPLKTYLNFRNNLLLLYKNHPDKRLNIKIFVRMLMDGLSALLFLLSLKFNDIHAIIRAHRDFRKKKKDYNKFRSEAKEKHKHPSHKEIYRRSVVIDYFLLGNKTFNKLRGSFGLKMNTNQ
ncbi:glycosyltransferase family 2 protein [Bacteroidota bacterium]